MIDFSNLAPPTDLPPPSRSCQECGKLYQRQRWQTKKTWDRQKFCSDKCQARSRMSRWRAKLRGGGQQPEHKGSYHAMSYQEIAAELGITVDQVRNAETSGLRKLKRSRLLREFVTP
jgi:hypothetical protein